MKVYFLTRFHTLFYPTLGNFEHLLKVKRLLRVPMPSCSSVNTFVVVSFRANLTVLCFIWHVCIIHIRARRDLNPFTLRVPQERIVCYSHTFENNFEIKRMFTKYQKESYCLASDKHSFFKYFPTNAFVRQMLLKLVGLFWLF